MLDTCCVYLQADITWSTSLCLYYWCWLLFQIQYPVFAVTNAVQTRAYDYDVAVKEYNTYQNTKSYQNKRNE